MKHSNIKYSSLTRTGLALLLLFIPFFMVVKPVQAANLDSNKVAALREAADQRWARAFSLAEKTKDPVITETVEWLYLTQSKTVERSFNQIRRFLEQEDWPLKRRILLIAEEKLPSNWSPQEAIAWFKKYPPLTANAAIRYIRALEEINPSEAKAYAKDYWISKDLDYTQQQEFLNKFGSYLTKRDHEERLDYLVWGGEHRNAQQLMKLVDLPVRLNMQARIKLSKGDVDVERAIADVPAEYQNTPGLLYERARWRRKKDLDTAAMDLMVKPMKEVKRRDLMWKERSVLARRFIEKKQYAHAYKLVSTHEQVDGFGYAEAEWMAGWLALNFLNEPMKAFRHFYSMYEKVSTAMSKSRGAYWAGLASLKAGDETIAKQWLAVSARYSTLFYGQLANAKLRQLDKNFKITLLPIAPEPTQADRNKFYGNFFVQSAQYLAEAGFSKSKDVMFNHLVEKATSPVEYNLIAELAERYKSYDISVNTSKEALNKGVMMLRAGYPMLDQKEIKRIDGVEEPLVHAIIRQESAFKVDAMSPVGAMGLMQLMPGTARDMAKRVGIPYNQGKLSQDRSYNVDLGSEYLNVMLARYDGYYPLAIASYNAGPGRVSSMMKQIGDPRKGEIDMVDWIEMIPIYETRNYVQRVLEAMHVYRMKASHQNHYVQNVEAYAGEQTR